MWTVSKIVVRLLMQSKGKRSCENQSAALLEHSSHFFDELKRPRSVFRFSNTLLGLFNSSKKWLECSRRAALWFSQLRFPFDCMRSRTTIFDTVHMACANYAARSAWSLNTSN